MSSVRSRDTKPEMALRRELWHNGIHGYRLHSSIVGHPDLYFPGARLAVFVDGCFWHGCPECKTIPSTRKEFWLRKIEANRERDRTVDSKLVQIGIVVVRVWEHEVLSDPKQCLRRIDAILEERRRMIRGSHRVMDGHCAVGVDQEMP